MVKFGRTLHAKQHPKFRGQYIPYKSLKRHIKAIVWAHHSDAETSTLDAAFFNDINESLKVVNHAYTTEEERVYLAVCAISSELENLASMEIDHALADQVEEIRLSMRLLEREQLHLDTFVELNKTGFEKILKKHDKKTGRETREKFIDTILDVQPFVIESDRTELELTTVKARLAEWDSVLTRNSIRGTRLSLPAEVLEPLSNSSSYSDMDTYAIANDDDDDDDDNEDHIRPLKSAPLAVSLPPASFRSLDSDKRGGQDVTAASPIRTSASLPRVIPSPTGTLGHDDQYERSPYENTSEDTSPAGSLERLRCGWGTCGLVFHYMEDLSEHVGTHCEDLAAFPRVKPPQVKFTDIPGRALPGRLSAADDIEAMPGESEDDDSDDEDDVNDEFERYGSGGALPSPFEYQTHSGGVRWA